MTTQKLQIDDVFNSLTGVQNSLQGKVADKKQTLVTAGAVAGIVMLLLFFLLGKRSGKKKTTFVEIRRV